MKVVVQLILAVFCLFAFTQCEDRIGNREVIVFGINVKFYEALENCEKLNMNLLMVRNSSEEQEASALTRKHKILSIWLAATDIGHESEFYSTITDEPLTYTNWNPNEPNNAGDREHCIQLVGAGWNDVPCGFWNGYICEKIN